MSITTEAESYIDAFVAEFGSAPDLDSTSDAEHATTALASVELRGVAWEQWAAAVRAEVSRREQAADEQAR